MKNTPLYPALDLLQIALAKPPPHPVKGHGCRGHRCCFPHVRRKNGRGLMIWNAIPLAHKAELHYGSAGRSSFQYRGVGGNIVISNEAWTALKELGLH